MCWWQGAAAAASTGTATPHSLQEAELITPRATQSTVCAQPLQGLCEVQRPRTDARRAGIQPSFAFQVIAVNISFSIPIVPRKRLSVFIHAPAVTSPSAFGWATLKQKKDPVCVIFVFSALKCYIAGIPAYLRTALPLACYI